MKPVVKTKTLQQYCLCGHKEEIHGLGWRCHKCTCAKFEIDNLKY